MAKLPVLSGHKVIKALSKIGFQVVGRKGSHIRLKKKQSNQVWIVLVPLNRELSKGTLKSIIRQSGLKREEFIRLFK